MATSVRASTSPLLLLSVAPPPLSVSVPLCSSLWSRCVLVCGRTVKLTAATCLQTPLTSLIPASGSLDVGVIRCDSEFFCPTKTSCCRDAVGRWSCCPFQLVGTQDGGQRVNRPGETNVPAPHCAFRGSAAPTGITAVNTASHVTPPAPPARGPTPESPREHTHARNEGV